MDGATKPRVGTAGWSIPGAARAGFPAQGSQLQRYGARFSCVEIDSSFYRPHRAQTYERWAASVGPDFRFAVKAPKTVTHTARLRDTEPLLAPFFEAIGRLGPKLGPVRVQLPPSLAFDHAIVADFLAGLRQAFAGDVVLEPRHRSWFADEAEALLAAHRIARAAADPALCPQAAAPGGWTGLRYWRLHGSPRMYYSAYGEARLADFAARMMPGDWAILDNTAEGAALGDALCLQGLVESVGATACPGAAL